MENTKLKEALASLAKDKGQRDALAQMFVEYIQPQHIATDFVGMILNSRSLKEGDMLIKKVRKGIEVRTLVPGSIPLKTEVTVSERANYVLDGSVVGLTANEWELESGELGTVQELRNEMMMKLKDSFQTKVFTALSTIWTAGNTPSNFASAGGSITAVLLKAAIDQVVETTGGVRAVVGSRAALLPITEFGAFWSDGSALHRVDSQLEQVMNTGWLGRYYGAPIVAISQQWDNPEDYNTLIPTDKILVIGENVGEFITYGEARPSEWTDPRVVPPQWNFQLYQRFGMIIDKAQGIYVIGGIS